MEKMSTIKVQIVGCMSVKSAIESGFDAVSQPLTFHAFSEEMKARVLERFLGSPAKIGISYTNETPRTGEWHEPMVKGAVFNR